MTGRGENGEIHEGDQAVVSFFSPLHPVAPSAFPSPGSSLRLHPSSFAFAGYPVISRSLPCLTISTPSSCQASEIFAAPRPPIAEGASLPPIIKGATKTVTL